MRPGQVCPGKAKGLFLPGREAPASMRPGQVCPGKDPMSTRSRYRQRSFNEARASLPGKVERPAHRTATRHHGFNEARASLPGKGLRSRGSSSG